MGTNSPVLPLKKQRLREIKQLVQEQTARPIYQAYVLPLQPISALHLAEMSSLGFPPVVAPRLAESGESEGSLSECAKNEWRTTGK